MPGTVSVTSRVVVSKARERRIVRPLWLATVAIAVATISSPVVFAASGKGSVTDAVAVTATASTSSLSVAPSRTGGWAETLIADFRYGSPRMGSTPRLPIPPPHRMRSGSAHPAT
jgi:hypothetical protein